MAMADGADGGRRRLKIQRLIDQGAGAEVKPQHESRGIERDERGERGEDEDERGGVEEEFGALEKRQRVVADEDAIVVIRQRDGVHHATARARQVSTASQQGTEEELEDVQDDVRRREGVAVHVERIHPLHSLFHRVRMAAHVLRSQICVR